MMTFRCLLIGQSLLLINHHHFRSQISTIGPYHCIRNDQISWKQVWNRPNRTSDGYDLIKIILAWSTAQIQSQIRLHVGSATLDPIPRLEARLGSTSARLGSRLMMWHVDPSVMTCLLTGRWCGCWHGIPTVHDDITLTSGWCHPWHAYCACWHNNYVMLTSSISGSVTWVGSTGILVGSAHPGEEDAWGASARVGRRLAGEWWRVRSCPTSDFDAVFTSGFVSSSSTQWYGQNTILTTFIFWAKIKHHFKPSALIPIVGESGSPMRGPGVYWYLLIGGLSTLTQYLTWFGKTAYIHGRVHIN